MKYVLVVFGFLAFAVLMDTIVKIQKMRIRESKGGGKLSDAESREIQELFRGFEELSKRVESLETILMDQAQKGPGS